MALTQVSRGLLSTSIVDNGNATAITIDSSENVGIGSTPISLDGNAAPGLTVSSNGPFILLQDANNSDKVRYISNNTGEFQFGIVGDNGTTGKTEHMRLDSSGNVLVGKTSTGDYVTGIEMQPAGAILSYRTGGVASIFGRTDDGEITRFTRKGSIVGAIGARTSSELYIALGSTGLTGSSTGGGALLPTSGGTSYTDASVDLGFNAGRFKDLYLSGKMYINNDIQMNQQNGRFDYDGGSSGGALRFFSTSANTERARITSGGDLLVGTTSSSGSSGQGIKIRKVSSDGVLHIVGATSTTAQDALQVYSTGASAYRFFVQYNGQVNATSTSINAISDVSLKENVRDLDKGLETILALQPRRFDWKNGDGNDIMGFVAQEVETVLPELVHDYKYSDEETKLGLKMGDMIPSLVKAIQEQQATITALTARIEQLENN